MPQKKPAPNSERMTVNLTADQMRRLEEVRNVRSRTGNFVSKNDLIRATVTYYLAAQEDLPGSRRAIAKGVESKVDVLDGKIEILTAMLGGFIEQVNSRRRER